MPAKIFGLKRTYCFSVFIFAVLFGAPVVAHVNASAESSAPVPVSVFLAGFDELLVPIGESELSKPLIHPPTSPVPMSGIERLRVFIELNTNTVWEASLQLNLGLAYYRNGYFSKAFDAYGKAWSLSKRQTDLAGKSLADRAFGELIRMHARLGHDKEVTTLLAEVKVPEVNKRTSIKKSL